MGSLLWSLFVIGDLYLSGDMARVVDKNGHPYDMCYDDICLCDIDTNICLRVSTIRMAYVITLREKENSHFDRF